MDLRERALTPSFTEGALAPAIWMRPDSSLAAAGIEGESVVARVRVVAMLLLMIAPTWNITHAPEVPIYVAGFVVTLSATLIAIIIWRLIGRGRWRPWVGFASSAFDVTMVSTALVSFYVVGSPLVALNSSVTFEMYFLAITATSLRYDARICITSGALAIVQYGGMWAIAASRVDLADPAYVADAGPYLPVDLATRLVLMAIATLLAITLVRRAQRLLYLAARDRLTGLYNRGHFDRALDGAVETAARSGRPLALAILDIDHFKQINDQYGHASGDKAIRTIAERLQKATRRTDLVARYGGEEFVVLMPETPPDLALLRMDAIRLGIADEPLDLGDGPTITIDFSAGIAGTPADHETIAAPGREGSTRAERLLLLADKRLLEAKRTGRARCIGSGVPEGPQIPWRTPIRNAE